MHPKRGPLEALTTPGYVSMITGRPGVGKTTLALMACARHGRCTYISYADPSGVIEGKMKSISPGFSGSLKVVNALSGSPGEELSIVTESARKGELVVIDTVDAMLYEVREGLRALLQILYGSVKTKQGSLVLISEGGPAASQLMYVADALVEMEFEEVLGRPVRAVKFIKDRDMPIESQRYYLTLSEMSIIEPFEPLQMPKLGRLKLLKVPPYGEISALAETGPNILTEFSVGMSDLMIRLIEEFFIAHFLIKGYSVNYLIGPNERECTIKEEVKSLAGDSAKRLRIINVSARSLGFSATKYLQELKAMRQGDKAVNFVNLLAEEDFAINAPLEYENFVYLATKSSVESGTITILYGSEALRSVKIQEKYANALRKYTNVDGFVFWRSIKPLGPVFALRASPEKGRLEYVEMM